jgi:hypothetical protein
MKAFRDLFHNMLALVCLSPAVRTADTTGTSVDLRDYDANLLVANIGTPGVTFDGTNKLAIEVKESDDNVTFTAVADIDLLNPKVGVTTGTMAMYDGTIDAAGIVLNGYRGNKRYILLSANFIGTHGTGTPVSASVHVGLPHNAPTV